MSDTAIRIENLSKQYRLGVVGTGTLTHDLKRWWARVRGKEDPTLQIGMENRLAEAGGEYVYALKDINLEVKRGDVLGIIGKNGAGKSTLLKILSRVTSPTTGVIDMYGRVASLLEVGTGFHPELTGRENIFLNGAIMGMSKREIRSHFDEIVDFSGVGKYIDTPVKRYSSGMYVRLAFAVSAYLEHEILLVDEVLAVGDAEFQKKAIGKMQDVSRNEGRTVLFVSHNMAAVKNLCNSCAVLQNGTLAFNGPTAEGVAVYLQDTLSVADEEIVRKISWLTPDLTVQRIEVNGGSVGTVVLGEHERCLTVRIAGTLRRPRRMSLVLCVYDENDTRVATFDPAYLKSETPLYEEGDFVIEEKIVFPQYISKADYFLDLYLLYPNVEYLLCAPRCLKLQVHGFVAAHGSVADSKAVGFYFLERAGERVSVRTLP
jgi:lipopolysaccharide transport system ATP-binding protein